MERSKDEGQRQADHRQKEVGQKDAYILLLPVQIVELHDVVVYMIGHVPGEKGGVLPLDPGELQLGDVQPVQPQPGHRRAQEKQLTLPV